MAALRRYFAPLPAGGFTGAYFERLGGGGGDRPDVANTFTSDDIVAVSMLSVPVPAAAALQLLEARGPELSDLLAKIPTDVAFAELTADEVGDVWPVRDAYRELLAVPGIGETTATKLLARKRPHLVPILDAVVTAELSVVKGRYWVPLHAWLTADGRAQHRRLEELRLAAGARAGGVGAACVRRARVDARERVRELVEPCQVSPRTSLVYFGKTVAKSSAVLTSHCARRGGEVLVPPVPPSCRSATLLALYVGFFSCHSSVAPSASSISSRRACSCAKSALSSRM